jgi:aminobenzoyl-glutamate transport protein
LKPVPTTVPKLVERGGNALPHPATLFASLAALVVIASGIASRLDLEVAHPGTGELIRPVSLLNLAGLHARA